MNIIKSAKPFGYILNSQKFTEDCEKNNLVWYQNLKKFGEKISQVGLGFLKGTNNKIMKWNEMK